MAAVGPAAAAHSVGRSGAVVETGPGSGGGSASGAVEAPNSLGLTATYDVEASLKTTNGRLTVSSTASVTNTTDADVSALTFSLLPAKIGNLVLDEVQVDGAPTTATVSDQSVIVDLPAPLAPTGQADVRIDYRATLTTTKGDKNFMFTKYGGTFTAYRWVPWLSRATAFARSNFGETWVTMATPHIEVRLTTDVVLKIAATGACVADCNQLTQTWVAENVRDFSIAASAAYKTRKLTQPTAYGNVTITAYYRQLPPDKLLYWAGRAVKRYSNKVGRYPYADLRVAETPFGGGMESPQVIWLSPSDAKRIPYIVTHEIGHQWFYGTLGNDQAQEPFADEALTDFLARNLLKSFRKSSCALKRLDKTVYQYGKKCYYPVIYVQGSNYLDAYRKRVSPARFWAGLRNYYETYFLDQNGLGGTRKLLDALDAAAGSLGGSHKTRFPSLYP